MLFTADHNEVMLMVLCKMMGPLPGSTSEKNA